MVSFFQTDQRQYLLITSFTFYRKLLPFGFRKRSPDRYFQEFIDISGDKPTKKKSDDDDDNRIKEPFAQFVRMFEERHLPPALFVFTGIQLVHVVLVRRAYNQFFLSDTSSCGLGTLSLASWSSVGRSGNISAWGGLISGGASGRGCGPVGCWC